MQNEERGTEAVCIAGTEWRQARHAAYDRNNCVAAIELYSENYGPEHPAHKLAPSPDHGRLLSPLSQSRPEAVRRHGQR